MCIRDSRVAISAKVVADMISAVGVNRVLTVDLHAEQIQGFFSIPVDYVYGSPVLTEEIERQRYENLTVVSPDVGGVVRARAVAKQLNVDLAIIDKRRPTANDAQVMNIIGDVEDRRCIMVDDIVDSGGTLCNAAAALMDSDAISVDAYVTHGVLSGAACERVNASKLEKLLFTNTIAPTEEILASDKFEIIKIAPLIGEAMRRTADEHSVSSLFD